MRHKIISAILFVMFMYFASLQFNDPDPEVWVTIYGIVGVIFALNIFNVYSRIVTLVVIIGLGLYSLSYFGGVVEWLQQPDKSEVFGMMRVDRMYIEESREFLGLVICIGALIYLYRSRRQ